jgi:signal transduction histidine kinase
MGAIAQIRTPLSEGIDPVIVRAAVDASPEALAIIEGECIVYANDSLRRLFGAASTAGILGRTLGEIDTVGDRPPVPSSTAKFPSNGREFLVLCARPASVGDQFGQAQRLEAVGRLVGGVAHDFNNLLTGIVLCCDLLLVKLESGSPLRRYAEEMRKAGGHGTRLIQQLLPIARPRKSEPTPVSLNDVIGGMEDLLARLIGENVLLKLKLGSGLRLVTMDAAQAEQIVLNLVLNARDAMPDGGQVSLTTRNCVPAAKLVAECASTQKTWVRLEVTDTGCGMDKQTCARIFEPFFTTKDSGHGNGVGLATVQEIVKHAKGTIEVASRPGKGTRIVICLPGPTIPRSKSLKRDEVKV